MKKLMLAAMFSAMLSGCGDGGSISFSGGGPIVHPAGVQSVRLLNRNAVFADLVVVMFIERESMTYSAARPGVTTQEWTKSITAEEFATLRRIVEEENLLAALAVPPRITSDPCNHAGMVVTITRDDIPREFTISGAGVCDTSTNKGLLRLFDFMDSLATKYRPK